MRELNTLQVNTGAEFEKFCPFPVGYIYLSTDSTSPADLYGGTWTALNDDKFLLPSDSWNTTGGSSSHTHWQSIGYSNGEYRIYISGYQNVGDARYSRTKRAAHFEGPITNNVFEYRASDITRENSTYPTTTLPPYRECYAWYRVS